MIDDSRRCVHLPERWHTSSTKYPSSTSSGNIPWMYRGGYHRASKSSRRGSLYH